jgi:hypothetical protein
MSLLEKARTAQVPLRSKRGASSDEVELAVAWFKGQVSSAQVAVALGQEKPSGITAWACRILQAALASRRADLIAIDEDEEGEDRPLPAGR